MVGLEKRAAIAHMTTEQVSAPEEHYLSPEKNYQRHSQGSRVEPCPSGERRERGVFVFFAKNNATKDIDGK